VSAGSRHLPGIVASENNLEQLQNANVKTRNRACKLESPHSHKISPKHGGNLSRRTLESLEPICSIVSSRMFVRLVTHHASGEAAHSQRITLLPGQNFGGSDGNEGFPSSVSFYPTDSAAARLET
jgi:hypothetical protein